MTPFSRAAERHNALGCPWSFAEIVEAHAQGGWVIITPAVFLLIRPVRHDWTDSELRDPHLCAERPDCLHVWLLAGDYRQAFQHLPCSVPFVSCHRHGKRKVMTLGRARSWLAGSRRNR